MSNDNSNGSAPQKALAIIPRTVDEVRNLAKMFAASSLLPNDLRGKEADVFVSIVAGQELGLPPMAALRGVHIIKGRPILSADTMVGVVLGRGIAEYFTCTDESATSVTYETKRVGSPKPQRCTWTMEDAKRAGLDGDNWRKYPRAMLKARCKAALARDVFPDVLAGCYDESEAAEIAGPPPTQHRAPANDAIDAEIVAETPAGSSLTERIAVAETLEDLKAFAPECNKLAKGSQERAAAIEAYKKRELEIKTQAAAQTGDAA